MLVLLFHARAEHSGGRVDTPARRTLEALAIERLTEEEGMLPGQAVELAQGLLTAITHRLVLLAPIVQDHVGFDVRSLPEFMAAKTLTTGHGAEVITKLEALAVASH